MTQSNPPPPAGDENASTPYSVAPSATPTPGSVPPVGAAPAPGATPVLSYRSEDGSYIGPPPDPDSRTMGMLCHLLGIFTGFVGPLIIWLMKKDQSPFVDDQGKEALNWHFTIMIGFVAGFLTWCLFIGMFLVAGLAICNLIFSIFGTMKANQGIAYRYPWSIKFIK